MPEGWAKAALCGYELFLLASSPEPENLRVAPAGWELQWGGGQWRRRKCEYRGNAALAPLLLYIQNSMCQRRTCMHSKASISELSVAALCYLALKYGTLYSVILDGTP